MEGVIYLTPGDQGALPYQIKDVLPWDHFARKNIGYMHAIHHGAKVIYDVDDDNSLLLPDEGVPHAGVGFTPALDKTFAVRPESVVHNPYPCFGGPANVWPRGYPLDAVNGPSSAACDIVTLDSTSEGPAKKQQSLGVVQILANHDPDVDAVYRLTYPPGGLPFDFNQPLAAHEDTPIRIVPPEAFTPYNAQATVHFSSAFWGLLLPATVHGRVSDIWRSYFTQALLPSTGGVVAFAPAGVKQVRNPHNYLADFEAELPLYERSGALVRFLQDYRRKSSTGSGSSLPVPQRMEDLAITMYEHGIVDEQDVKLTQAWINDLAAAGYIAPGKAGVSTEASKPEHVENDTKEVLKQANVDAGGLPVATGKPASQVVLVVAVVSIRPERRTAIRNSWLQWNDERAVVRFFTEAPTVGAPGADEEAAALIAESEAHGDLIVLDIPRGMNFAVKLLAAMHELDGRYSFDFFLRLDDDYFLCIHRLLNELEALRDLIAAGQQAPMLYGGHFHCDPGSVRADEAYMLLSAGLVQRVLSTPNLPCTAYAGATAGWWFTAGNVLNKDGDIQAFNDPRVDHRGFWWNSLRNPHPGGKPEEYPRVCHIIMGIHDTFPDNMAKLWAETKDNPGPPSVDAETLSAYQEIGICGDQGDTLVIDHHFYPKSKPCDSFVGETQIHCGRQGC